MSKNYERLLSAVRQQVNDFKRCVPFLKIPKEQYREETFWKLAGIHQSALFVLSTDEYYKFKEAAEKMEKSIMKPSRKIKEPAEIQTTLF